MKVIHNRPQPCSCTEKLWDYLIELQGQHGTVLGIGSIVECDCGQRWTLSESQRDGRFWVKRVLRDKLTMTTLRN